MSLFEIIAAGLGIISVFFSTRQNVLAWPTSLLNNGMYFVVFLEQRLFALMALQLFFGAIAIYGWYQWLFGGTAKTELKVSRVPPALAAVLAAIALAGILLLWYVLRRYTPDPHPLIDALFFAVSLIAQWMMARKYFECWPVWVAINCLAVPFFFLQHSYPTMVQYAVFLVLAILGWRQWKASLAAGRESDRPVAAEA
jgi:nicotinamide mononucleotide transporter